MPQGPDVQLSSPQLVRCFLCTEVIIVFDVSWIQSRGKAFALTSFAFFSLSSE